MRFSVAKWLEVTITLLNYTHFFASQAVYNWWVFLKGDCSRDYKIICKFLYLSFWDWNFPLKMFTIIWYVSSITCKIYIRWYFTFQEAEAGKEGNGWIGPVLKGLKKSSPTGLKITLRSVINFCCMCVS